MNKKKATKKRSFWTVPWGYQESFIIALELLACGFLLDWLLGTAAPVFSFPSNIWLGILFTLVVVGLFFLSGKVEPLRWLYSIPASISALSLFGLLSMIMALVPQLEQETPSLQSILNSWTYFFSYIYIVLTLLMVTVKRLVTFTRKDICFILNHLGVLVVLFGAGLGAGDVQKLKMYLKEGELAWSAFDKQNQSHDLPFAFKLNDFHIEEYKPKMGIIDNQTGELLSDGSKLLITSMGEEGTSTYLGDYEIQVVTYYDASGKVGENYQPVQDMGAMPSAMVKVNGKAKAEWLTCGSPVFPPQSVKLNDNHSLVMAPPEPKRFYSDVKLFEKGKDSSSRHLIEVNQPLAVAGWKVYQLSYDETMGKWSSLSILELVRDPWLWVVYVGCFLMILGAVWVMFKGNIIGS